MAQISDHPHKRGFSPKRINLALQGGGSQGAFTWRVLDHLLEDGRPEIAAISGTSACAMNAVALGDGFIADRCARRRGSMSRLRRLPVSQAYPRPELGR